MARLLIVDDSSMTRDLIERMLVGEFEAFDKASDGKAALDLLQERWASAGSMPTLIVSDVDMKPGMDGDEMAKMIAGLQLGDIPLVLCSSNPDLPAIAERLGVRYFQKNGSLVQLKPMLLQLRDETSHDGVHESHCCDHHGCKYGSEDCPVVGGRIKQECPCETCGMGDPDTQGFYDGEMVWHPQLRDLVTAIHAEIGADGAGKLSAETLGHLLFTTERFKRVDQEPEL